MNGSKVEIHGQNDGKIKVVISYIGVSQIKMCLNETHSKIRTGKHLSGAFPIKNGPK
jgi:hypothetical protein